MNIIEIIFSPYNILVIFYAYYSHLRLVNLLGNFLNSI